MAHELSNVCLIWPEARPPREQEVLLRLKGHPLVRPAEEHLVRPPTGALWSAPYFGRETSGAYVVWATPLAERPKVEACDDPRCTFCLMPAPPDDARFAIGLTTFLDPTRPLESFHVQLQLLRALCPHATHWHDVNAQRFLPFEDLERMTDDDEGPGILDACCIHALLPRDPKGHSWIHTHGLQRLAFPDVEILRIEERLMRPANEMIHHFVRSWFGRQLPPPRTAFDVGCGAQVAWMPYPQALRSLPSREPGGWSHRKANEGHRGRRIVLVDPRRCGPNRWKPPVKTLAALSTHRTVPLSPAETRRQTQAAKNTWTRFAALFAEHGTERGWEFLMRLGYATADGNREHLWFTLLEIKPGRARARLRSTPRWIDDLAEGAVGWHDLERLTDWSVHTPHGVFQPSDVPTVT